MPVWAWPQPQPRRVLIPEEYGAVIYRIDKLNPKAEVTLPQTETRPGKGKAQADIAFVVSATGAGMLIRTLIWTLKSHCLVPGSNSYGKRRKYL